MNGVISGINYFRIACLSLHVNRVTFCLSGCEKLVLEIDGLTVLIAGDSNV